MWQKSDIEYMLRLCYFRITYTTISVITISKCIIYAILLRTDTSSTTTLNYHYKYYHATTNRDFSVYALCVCNKDFLKSVFKLYINCEC